MCGIAGYFAPRGLSDGFGSDVLQIMLNQIQSRGPDGEGFWFDKDQGVGFAHRRLAIVELSPAGHQPMISISGRFILIFNGEIYNHLELRARLNQSPNSWRGNSDTETLLMAIECWGLEKALQSTVGMFALALWDRMDRKVFLARDRMGEKPLFYGWQQGVLLFGSELKALEVHPSFEAEIDRSVLPLYLRNGYIPAPWSIWKGLRKLLPGTWISFSDQAYGLTPEPTPYWSLSEVIVKSQSKPFEGSDSDAVDQLERLLSQSIAGQSIADVPIGAFLSGGVDSSSVVALMQAQSSRPVKTFTIGFEEAGFNEAEHAKAVAKYLGTDHTELYVSSKQAQQIIPLIPQIYDEPFADSSAIPTYILAQLARDHVAVSLSGDGGDELFGGYSRYSGFQYWQRQTARVPMPLRMMLSAGIRQLPKIGSLRNQRRLALLDHLLQTRHPADLYRALTSHWIGLSSIKSNTSEAASHLTSYPLQIGLNEPLDHAMFADLMTYLPDDILTKIDRATMAASLETRVPLLDHRIVEWSWTLPQYLKSRGGHQKWVLRELLYRYVPKQLIERPKVGFGVPIGEWLRGPLRGWAEDLLKSNALLDSGFLEYAEIKKMWISHLEGKNDYGSLLWIILMWQSFYSFNKDKLK